VRSRFNTGIADLRMTPITAQLEFPISVTETVEFYRKYYGPTQRSFEALAEEKQLEELCGKLGDGVRKAA
jgi:hypothetical protein